MEKDTADKVRGMVRRVVLKNIVDDGETQTASVEIAPGIWRDKVEIQQPYGVASSVPEDGAVGLAIAIGGNEDDLAIVSISNPSARMGQLSPGAAALYNMFGDSIVIDANGNINIKAGTSVVFTIGGVKVTISAEGVAFEGGTITHDGVVIDKTHIHTGVVPGGGLSGPPPGG